MLATRQSLVVLALAGLLSTGSAAAQEFDARIRSSSPGGAAVLREDVEGDAKIVATLHAGDAVTVYPAISSESHYFVKLKASKPGEGSGWIAKDRVLLAEDPAPPAAQRTPVSVPAARIAVAVSAPALSSTDIPKGHWARSAVEELVRIGLIRAPAGKFDGEHAVNRYELALLTERVVKHGSRSAAELRAELTRLERSDRETRGQVEKVAKRLADVEKKAANGESSKQLSRDVSSLRQTFTRSIASLALDRSKVEEFRAAWNDVLIRLERLEKKPAGQS